MRRWTLKKTNFDETLMTTIKKFPQSVNEKKELKMIG